MIRLSAVRMALAVVALGAAPTLAVAQQQQFGQTGPDTYVTWGTNNTGQRVDVTYFIGSGFTVNQANLIRSAASAWSGAGSGVNLVEVGSSAAGNIRIDYVPTGNFSLVDITRTSTPQPGTYPNLTPWNQIQNPVTLNVNSFFPLWDGSPAVQPGGTVDFQALSLALVGFGIGLGTAAPGDNSSVMQSLTSFPAGTGNHSLGSSDVAAIQAVYGTPEPATLALFGIGLAALGLTKRFRRASR